MPIMRPSKVLRPSYRPLTGRFNTIAATIRSSPLLSLISAFVSAYSILFLYVWLHSSNDPTSIFFSTSAYRPNYSTFRENQALAFLKDIDALSLPNSTISAPIPKFKPSLLDESICVGIPSYTRFQGAALFPATIGSLLHGLSPEERSRLYFVPFVPHVQPSVHPHYKKRWLSSLSDQVLDYQNLEADQIRRLNILEKSHDVDSGEKEVFDYSYLLRTCLGVGSPYILIVQDDVLAMDGWFHRTQAVIHTLKTHFKSRDDATYTRLFYAEEFLRHQDFSRFYRWSSCLIAAIPIAIITILRLYVPRARPYTGIIPTLVVLFIFIPLLIALFFAAGRATMTAVVPGLYETHQPEHCTQALLYSRPTAQALLRWLSFHHKGKVDSLINSYVDHIGGKKYSIVPAVMQHLGRRGQDIRTGSPDSRVWNFYFESFRPGVLRIQHRRAVAQMLRRAQGWFR